MKKDEKQSINRRSFLKASGIGAAGFALASNLPSQTFANEKISLPDSISARRIFPFNHKWLYSDKPTPDSTSLKFNDKNFQRVTIPHTNKMLPMNGFDEKEYMFVSVYRRHFRLPKELQNQKVFIDFGGVMTAAKVFINGQNLGEYRAD